MHLAGSFHDLQSAEVAVHALNGVFLHVAEAAVHLQHVVGCPHGHLGAEKLGHGRMSGIGLSGVGQPGGVIDQIAQGFDLGCGVSDEVLDGLLQGNRATKLFVLDSELDADLQRGLGPTQANGRQAQAGEVQRFHGDLESFPLLAQQIGRRQATIVEVEGVADEAP